MGFNIDGFLSEGLTGGGARPSLFKVIFDTLPPGVGNGGVARQTEFLIRSASLPAYTLDTVSVPYFGRTVNYAGDREFQPWSVTVMGDEDFKLRSMFENWSNQMNALVSNRMNPELGGLTNYKVDARVLQYSKAGPGTEDGVIRSYKFIGMFPTIIDQMQLDWEAKNAIHQFDIRLVYDYFVPEEFGEGEVYSPELPQG